MATNTYEALTNGSVVLSASQTSVTLLLSGNIPSTYTDLRLVANFKMANSTYQPYITLNSDTGTHYSTTTIRGDGSTATSGRHTTQGGWYPVPGPGIGTAGSFETWTIDLINYANTTTYKSALSRFGNASSIISANIHNWRGSTGSATQAITSITLIAESGSGDFQAGSSFTLYGIANADIGAYATGGIITYDSTYYYHTFGSSGTFTPKQSLSCDVLVVAGGGGGGENTGGGGGAGGLLIQSGRSVTATGYTVTIGAGGAYNSAAAGSAGGNTVFDTITALGGGGGNYGPFAAGGNGGSGGGGGEGQAGGSATQGNSGGATGYGNAGASGASSGAYGHGGGGGAGAAGTVGTTTGGGAGGDGYTSALINAMGAATSMGQLVSGNYYFAGGGGGGAATGTYLGGTGGKGGGGQGGGSASNGASGSAGTANTGGGGGSHWQGSGGPVVNGGSGVVIVRYAK